MSRSFSPRVSVVNSRGDHLRSLSSEAAKHFVSAGIVHPVSGAGRIREVELSQPAASHAIRTGEASSPALGVRFYRWTRLDGTASRIVEHHPRSTYE